MTDLHSTDAESAPRLGELRRLIVSASARANEGHIPSALSILEILFAEYFVVMPLQRAAGHPVDRFILSKGHASLGLYVVLAASGHFPADWLDSFGAFDSPLGGHPDSLKVPGVEASTGSLGHGLPFAVGLALGNRALMAEEARPRIVVLVGDGESNEGAIWEAAQLASHHALHELICLVDHNHSTDRALAVDPLDERFAAFGWSVHVVADGHDVEDLSEALQRRTEGKPTALIVGTTKGKGVPTMENNPSWHHASPRADELEALLGSIT